MREFLSWRFWLAIGALVGLTALAVTLTREDSTVEALPDEVAERIDPTERVVDLAALVFAAQADPGFDIVEGRTTARLQILIDGFRYMTIQPGTEGENRCAEVAELARCVVVADLLGDAVLWFAIVPLQTGNEIHLPPVIELREDRRVRLDNGWVVRRALRPERTCDTETSGLADFAERVGEGSTTIFDLETQQVVEVVCAAPAG